MGWQILPYIVHLMAWDEKAKGLGYTDVSSKPTIMTNVSNQAPQPCDAQEVPTAAARSGLQALCGPALCMRTAKQKIITIF